MTYTEVTTVLKRRLGELNDGHTQTMMLVYLVLKTEATFDCACGKFGAEDGAVVAVAAQDANYASRARLAAGGDEL